MGDHSEHGSRFRTELGDKETTRLGDMHRNFTNTFFRNESYTQPSINSSLVVAAELNSSEQGSSHGAVEEEHLYMDTWNKYQMITYAPKGEMSIPDVILALNWRYCASVGCNFVVHSHIPTESTWPQARADGGLMSSTEAEHAAAALLQAALEVVPRARIVVWLGPGIGMRRAGAHPAEWLQGHDALVATRGDGSVDASVVVLRNSEWARGLVRRWRRALRDCHPALLTRLRAPVGTCCSVGCLGAAVHMSGADSAKDRVRRLAADQVICDDDGDNQTAACESLAIRIQGAAAQADGAARNEVRRRYLGTRDGGPAARQGVRVISFSDRSAGDVFVKAAFRILQVRRSRAQPESAAAT